MANRDMLTEAIADAKALKETAIANAKAALEEAFTPRMKEMLSAKLQELDEEELDEADKMDEAKKKYRDDDRKDGGESKETKRTEKMKYGKDLAESEDIDEETDLDEILAELDEEMKNSQDTNEAEEAEEEVDVDIEMEDEDDIDLEEMSEDDLKSFIEDVIKNMVESGELEAGDEFEGEDEESEDEEIEIEDENETEEIMEGEEEKVNELYDLMMNPSDMEIITGILAGAVGIPAAALASAYAKDGIEAVKRLIKGKKAGMEEVEKTDKMEEELNELRSELHEVNLLNAKLLYTNKIFRAKNLTEAQKVKVLEAFDKATTVKEVKLVFETLSSEVKEKKSSVTESMIGGASKAAGIAPNKTPILEVNDQFARWQTLAGIKK
jgi:hypothetical protein